MQDVEIIEKIQKSYCIYSRKHSIQLNLRNRINKMLGSPIFTWWMDAGQTPGTARVERQKERNSDEDFLSLQGVP